MLLEVESLTASLKILGIIGVIPFPFNINKDACANWGVHCPILPDQVNTLKVSLPILPQYPAISVVVEIKLEDDQSKLLMCAKFKAQIV